jgi:hypothetical protein
MREPVRFSTPELLIAAARGLGKVDALGDRGVTLVSMDEIAAMAGVLALFGLVPIVPGATEIPKTLILQSEAHHD